MTETTVTPVAADDTSYSSQVIEPRETHETPRAGHMPEADAPKQEPAKPLSTRDAIAKAFDEAEKGDKAKAAEDAPKIAKAFDEATKVVKPEKADPVRGDNGKFAKAEPVQPEAKAEQGAPEKAAAERGAPEERQSEGRKYSEPPARFLPEARTKWANVPNEVKTEFHRVSQEMETEIGRYKQSSEAYEAVREFDDMARKSGTDLKSALTSYTNIENLLRSDPARGVAEVLRNIGLTPEKYAQHVLQNPQAHQFQQQAQPQPAQQQHPQDIEALIERKFAAMEQRQAVMPEITKFYTDYQIKPGSDVEDRLANVLQSGVLEQLYGNGLSTEERLQEAARIAGITRMPSQSAPEANPAPAPVVPQGRPVDPDGAKSVRGAPSSGQTGEAKPRFKSNREALEAALAQVQFR